MEVRGCTSGRSAKTSATVSSSSGPSRSQARSSPAGTPTTTPFRGGGPTGPARRPLFVVTHEASAESPEGGVYTFVTDGIESALEQAKAVADGKIVTVMGGASIGQQYIAAGLIDEISIHLVPVLFGSGTKMFEHLGGEHIQLEPIEVIETRAATHLRFRIVK